MNVPHDFSYWLPCEDEDFSHLDLIWGIQLGDQTPMHVWPAQQTVYALTGITHSPYGDELITASELVDMNESFARVDVMRSLLKYNPLLVSVSAFRSRSAAVGLIVSVAFKKKSLIESWLARTEPQLTVEDEGHFSEGKTLRQGGEEGIPKRIRIVFVRLENGFRIEKVCLF